MMTYESEILIDRPVEEVFDFVTTLDNLPSWSDTNAVTPASGRAGEVGTRYRLDMGRGPLRSDLEFETTGWKPGRDWSFKTVSAGRMSWDGRYVFDPVDRGTTRVRGEGQVSLKGWRRLLEPVVRGELRREEQAELSRLKQLLERSS